MKSKHLLLIGLLLALICFAVMTVMGRTCVYTLRTIDMAGEASDYTVSFDPEPAPVELTDQSMADGRLTLTFRSVHPGTVFVEVEGPENFGYLEKLYVHRLGAISVKFSQNLAVVHTPPGHAPHVAYDIDNADIPEIVGTIAGDDTILIVLAEDADRPTVLNHLSVVVPETQTLD
jgi:hypothetical protein